MADAGADRESCEHGTRVERSGVGQSAKAYRGLFCPENVRGCRPVWLEADREALLMEELAEQRNMRHRLSSDYERAEGMLKQAAREITGWCGWWFWLAAQTPSLTRCAGTCGGWSRLKDWRNPNWLTPDNEHRVHPPSGAGLLRVHP